jgi:manganese-dependent ADP-ribose/CDP-alcohol diphosphatase
MASLNTQSPPTLLLSFGAVADVQYANSENGADFKKTVVRRYRNALTLLTAALDEWTTQEETLGYPVQMIVQLGDLLDGRCQEQNHDRDECLERLLAQFNRLPTTVHRFDIIGNHELYNFTRAELQDPNGPLRTASTTDEILTSTAEILTSTAKTLPHKEGQRQASTFYSAVVVPGFRVVVIDAYEISTLNGTEECSTTQALDYLSNKNPNDIAKQGVDWTAGLEGSNKRFVPYNGAVSPVQLEWLSQTLQHALRQKERCLVLSHVSLQQGCCSESCVLWNYEEVMNIIHHPTGGTSGETPVVACLYGHAHQGGYVQDERGIHHVTLQSPLEAVGDEMSHATVDVYENQMHIRGKGRVPSRVLDFPMLAAAL